MKRITRIGALIVTDPKAAEREIVSALKQFGKVEAVAKHFGVSWRTLDRWLEKLNLRGRAAEFRAKMGGVDRWASGANPSAVERTKRKREKERERERTTPLSG